MFDITPIVEAVIALIGVIITCIVIPYVRSKTTAQQREELNVWIKIAVAAAEQIYQGAGRGEEKKQYVLDWLEDHNVTVDEDRIDALIEAAVYELTKDPGVLPIDTVSVQSLNIAGEEEAKHGN